MKLFETYNISITKVQTKDGGLATYAYIDPQKSTDDTRKIKDGIKNYGARWNPTRSVWGWYLSSDPTKLQGQLQKFVYPAIEFLNSQETQPEGADPRTADQMKAEFNQLLAQIDQVLAEPVATVDENNAPTQPIMSEKELKEKLAAFKQELVETMSSEEFLERLEPIIKFRNAQGHQLSLLNSLLIWIQNPKAKFTKARSTWATYYNRTVKKDAKALAINRPVTINPSKKLNPTMLKACADKATREYLAQLKKTSVSELTPGEKDELRVRINAEKQHASGGIRVYKMSFCYYDISDTEQMEGKEDVVGSIDDIENIEWTDKTSAPTDLTIKIYDAMLQIIQEAGIKLSFVDDLGGAMGVSKSGAIDVLKDTNKNAGADSTLIHEFAHEVLHQRYLKSTQEGKGDWCKYFIGTQQGRGIVEQQAELCAYLVLRFFNIKLMENINYIAIWGADASKACIVFDVVASVADSITNKIAQKLGMTTLNEDEGQTKITGLDVAELLGDEAVKVYNWSKANMYKTIKENFYNLYNRMSNL